jgi:glycerol-1-phosphate dehydrogenase [NAD(P)+]
MSIKKQWRFFYIMSYPFELPDISCNCDKHGLIDIDEMIVKENAIEFIPDYLNRKAYKKTVIVADQRTYDAAGKKVHQSLLDHNLDCSLCLLEDNKQCDVIADSESILQLLCHLDSSVEVVLAVGAGTIHDIVRFVCDKMDKPFISVPTAASVDGFTSAGAPIVIRGVKQTVQASSPIAIFADIDIISAAPQKMTAAGFGDMLAKYTSMMDWRFSHLLADEPYCEKTAGMTEKALAECVKHVDDIARSNAAGITVLMNSLILSGIAMLLAGHSRSASGAEHHLSHYWEMEFLRRGERQILHGAKVGVTTILIAGIYRDKLLPILSEDHLHRTEIKEMINHIPSAEQLKNLLNKLNGPTSPKDLNIDDELVEESLHEAIHLRERYTGLKFLNENNLI